MIVDNMADFGVLADTVEVVIAVVFMILGVWLTHRVQVRADKSGEQPAAANRGEGGGFERREARTFRE